MFFTDADYTDDLENTPAPAESLLRRLEQTVRGIEHYMNANKTEHTCFKQKCSLSTQSGKPLKSVNQFTYLGSNISSTKSDIKMPQAKVLNAFDQLLMIWKANNKKVKKSHFILSDHDKIKWDFFQAVAESI